MRPPPGSPLLASDLELVEFALRDELEAERVVRGRVVLPRAGRGALAHVLVVHGFKGFMDWGFFPVLGASLARAGLAAVLCNLSGSGLGEDPERMDRDQAFERDTHTRQLADLARVRAWIDSGAVARVERTRAGLLGHSRGGALALLHAAESDAYRALVTWAALAELDRYDEGTRALWRRVGYLEVPNARTGQVHRMGVGLLDDLERNRARLDVLAACRDVRAECLLVHGEADEAVPVGDLARLAQALGARARTLVVPGSGHTFGVGHPWSGSTPAWERVLAATTAHLVRVLA